MGAIVRLPQALLLGLALVVQLGQLAFAQSQFDPPKLDTDEQRLQFLLQVEQNAPDLFGDAVTYEIDMLALLEKEKALVRELQKNPAYVDLMKTRPPLQLLTISPVVRQRALDPQKLATWKDQLLGVAKGIQTRAGGRAPLDALRAETRLLGAELVKSDPNEFAIGLIQRLPKDRQKQVFKMPLDQKLAVLERELPEQIIFEPKGSAPVQQSRTEAVAKARRLFAAQADLEPLSSLAVLVWGGTAPMTTWDEVVKAIGSATEEQILGVTAKKALAETARQLASGVQDAAVEEKKLGYAIANAVEADLKPLYPKQNQTAVPANKGGERLVLREASPFEGIFRGCAGGDCATQYSYAYSNSPSERTYFIIDEKGVSRGYAQGTVVEVDGKKSFYLTCIAGKRVGKDQTKAIIQGLYQLRGELGVEQIALLTPEQAEHNLNFQPIRDGFEEMAAKAPKVPVKFVDREVRQILDGKVEESKYDSADAHREVRIYAPAEEAPQITGKAEPLPVVSHLQRAVSREDTALFALDLFKIDREAKAKKFANRVGLSMAQLEELEGVLENDEQKPVKAWLESVKAEFGKLQLRFDDKLLQTREAHFHFGQFAASDAMSDQNRKTSVNYLVDELKNEFDGDEALAFVRQHHEALEKIEKFTGFLESLLVGTTDDQDQLELLFSHGVRREVLEPKLAGIASNFETASKEQKDALLRFVTPGAIARADVTTAAGRRGLLSMLETGLRIDNRRAAVLRLASEAASVAEPQVQELLVKGLRTPGLESISFEGLRRCDAPTERTQLALIEALRDESRSGPRPDTYPARLLEQYASRLGPQAQGALDKLAGDSAIKPEFRSFASTQAMRARAAAPRADGGCVEEVKRAFLAQ